MEGSYSRACWVRAVILAPVGVGLIALSSWVSWTIPGTNVPQSAQTLAVVLVGGFCGTRLGVGTLGLYLLLGGLGVPVFADGASGWAHLVGPTSGYLAGFVAAAAVVGSASDRELLKRPGSALCVMVTAHVVILLLGWSRLAITTGAEAAFQSGVAPFVLGGLAKAALAAAIVVAASRSQWLNRGWLRVTPCHESTDIASDRDRAQQTEVG